MAVVAISDSNTRGQDMEGAVSGATLIGSGPGISTFVEAVYQGLQTWGIRNNSVNTLKGLFVTITSTDMTVTGDEVVLFKGNVVNSFAMSTIANGGALRHRIGSSTSNYYEYYVGDDGGQGDIDYPIKGGWVISPIDPNEVSWRDAETTAPTLTAIVEMGISAAVTTTSNNENVIFDSVDIGPGLFLIGGDSTDPDGVWNDFVIDDEGTATAGRFGHVTTQEGILFVFGTLAIGQTSAATSTLTVFNDTDEVLIFPGGRVADSWNQILIDTATANTDIDMATTVFKGRGRSDLTHFFSSAGDVDGTNDEIDITAHGFLTGDLVRYTDEGGTAISGLTDATDFFVRAITVDAIALYAVGTSVGRQNAYSDTSRIVLTAASTGENHKLVRNPNTFPDLTQVGTNASASFDANSCTFDGFREITLTSRGTFLNCSLLSIGGVTLASGTLNGCIFQNAIIEEGEPIVTDFTLDNITSCTFTSEGKGHAVEIDTAGTYTYSGNTHTGYGPNREQFDTETDVTGGATDTIAITTHPWTNGEQVFYNDEGGAETIGLTDGNRYYVRSVDANTVAMYNTADGATNDTDRIDLTASTAGNGETHSLYSGTAAILNSSGGLVTINVTGGVGSPTVRNTPGSTTTVNNNIQITLTGLQNPTEVRVFDPAGSLTEVAGQEDVTGGTFVFSRPASNIVDIRIFAITFDPADLLSFTIPASDTSIPIQQIFDRDYNNP